MEIGVSENWRAAETQDERISLLEKRPLESEVTELKNTVKNQGDEIAQLKARIREFETMFSTSYKDKPEEDVPLSEANEEISVSFNKPFVRKGTLIAISISFNESFTLRKWKWKSKGPYHCQNDNNLVLYWIFWK